MEKDKKNEQKFYPIALEFGKELEEISLVYSDCLFITNFSGAENYEALKNAQITHIVNVNSNEKPLEKYFKYYTIDNLVDDPKQAQNLKKHMEGVFKFIDDAFKKKGKVLVHCAAGLSRSVTFVLGYLMMKKNMKLIDAFAQVRSKRKWIWPNIGFMEMLINLEKTKFKKNTITVAEYKKWTESC